MITHAYRFPQASSGHRASAGADPADRAVERWEPVARRVFPGLQSQVREVRRFVEHTLHRHPARPQAPPSEDLVETACLLASEVATNAVRHTRSGQALGTFTVTVGRGPGGVTVEVRDLGARRGAPASEPRIREPGLGGESGRGLALVDGLAAGWGSRSSGREEPRAVWFRLDEALSD